MKRDEDAARRAVRIAMTDRGWSQLQLAREAKADPATVGDFLAGHRWPRVPTQSKLERALGWPAGRIEDIATGRAPANETVVVGAGPQDARYVSHRSPDDPPASVSDDEVLAAISRMAAELEDLKKRLQDRGKE